MAAVTINTGNVLNLIDIKKKAGQNATEELVDSLHLTINEWENNSSASLKELFTLKNVAISRAPDDIRPKMKEDERQNQKIGIKIFLHDDVTASLEECLEQVYKSLGIETIDNVILAYSPLLLETNNHTNGVEENDNDTNSKCDQILPGLKKLWTTLEEFVNKGRILQLGVADLEENCFKRLHNESSVKPTIIQINLASCCVVPPGLQSFCKDNDIQLLTHSDPQDIIPKDNLSSLFSGKQVKLGWCVRYQVHIRCRGVLALKGYITNVKSEESILL